jgi:hypothetical protein
MAESIQIRALVWQQATIPYSDFPVLLAAHLKQYPGTPEVERLGLALREGDPMKWDDLVTFMEKVAEWAGRTGPRVIRGQVLKGDPIDIEGKVRDAIAQLRSDRPSPVAALKKMDEVKGLDVSFASKLLRLLFPEYCPVLDSILSCRLGYAPTADGYGAFACRCTEIAGELNRAQIASTFPGRTDWRPSDVEAALFAWVNGWRCAV